MKKFITSLFLVIISISSSLAQSTLTSDQLQIQLTLRDLFEGLSTYDLAAMKKVLTPDMLILEHGVVWNMDSIVAITKRPHAADFKRINKLAFIQTEVKGDMAFVTYDNQADIHANNADRTVKWLESAVLVREGKSWKIKMLHSTRLSKR